MKTNVYAMFRICKAASPLWTPLQVAGGQLQGKMGEFGPDTPPGRAGQPAELAGLYAPLAESGNRLTSGGTFDADGGTGAIRPLRWIRRFRAIDPPARAPRQ